MTPLLRTGIVVLALMFTASALAYALKPTQKLVDLQPREKLESLIPMQFGDWRAVPTANIVVANPQALETINRIYTETISRTYIDSRGRQIMLSIAYGEDQRDGMDIHYPEGCYPAQGFQLRSVGKGQISTPYGFIPAKRLVMVLGPRHEPVTYWTMIGDYPSLDGAHKKLNELRYSLKGVIADGLLFRVSSIERDPANAFHHHEEFIGVLLNALHPEGRKRLAGLTS